ncbi:MAG TPA: cyclic nucleotide-binding domain-containing protein [Dongiaceae bacterium]|nr:cyclic nucleotide-binding domain-containing protein [Dongiaceae bacterium]
MAEAGSWDYWLILPWGDAAGHVSYLIIAVSYWLTNIYWLRVTAVIGLYFEIAYFVLVSGGALYTGIGWDAIFIAINLFHLLRLTRERMRLRLASDDRDLLRTLFDGLDDAQIGMLLNSASWHKAPVGEQLTIEGAPVPALMLIAAGQVSVDVGDQTVARMGPGSFIGEMAFLTGGTASATVIATQPTRVMKIEQQRLRTLLVIDSQIAAVMHRLLGADLAQKLRTRNLAA